MATASRIPQQVRLMHRPPGGAQDASRIPSSAIDPDHNLLGAGVLSKIIALIEGEPCHD
jgi:hypothetical protein